MSRVLRIDRGSELQSPRPTSQGFLRVDGLATRAGVLEYQQPDGSVRRELRPDSEVFSAAHLASFQGAPVTDDHPPAMITPKNARQYSVGTVLGEGRRTDADHVAVTMDVTDPAMQEKMKAKGKRELSPGYTVDLDETPGTDPKYGKYDAIQRNIEVNHLAVVNRARAGKSARVRMDSIDVPVGETPGDDGSATCTDAGTRYHANLMPKSQTPDQTEALEAAASELAREKTRADALEVQLTEERKRADTAEGAVEMLKAQATDADKIRTDADAFQALTDKCAELEKTLETERKMRHDAESPEIKAKAVQARVLIEMAARQCLGSETRFDSMPDRVLMELVCEKLRGVKFDSAKSDDFVRASFEIAVEDLEKNAAATRKIREVVNANRAQRADTVETAKQKRERETYENGRKPLPSARLVGKDA